MVTTSPEGSGPTIMFAETEAPRERPAMSRTNSAARFSSRPIPETKIRSEGEAGPTVSFAEPEYSERATSPSRRDEPTDAQINIPELLMNYNFKTAEDNASGSSYSSQGLPLSFNDLPSRAQYLILNELMRQNSSDAAVVLTTLPIPEEGTCESEEASVRYLSDVEVLTHDLPPVLLVLSNNMTVTVSL
ncbi:putative solute carrier family 12 member 3 protein [Phaeoacremonium minimum UCRPA7]|uniref:Putative solute carrier family 12 member 3 protein n=1 Tax=Phaeoacremonium minimum (strain UCR-PA7) TaxID=1286976 RepID=R8BEG5_PHAM7|nr:putative solute carrier family 12 member 3 protein [Phaeoacremonium minimum UCRPA7]EON97675.1 putative solute carrier family 12 member 3 protein [Phaeoacremonium minimum UCRPA7]